MAIKFADPVSEQEFELEETVNFKGTADSTITEVELWADDRWLLGRVPVSSGNWSFSYAFNAGGVRTIYAKGLDTSNRIVDQDQIWICIESLI